MWPKIKSASLQLLLLVAFLIGIHLWQTRDLLPSQSQSPNIALPVLDGGQDKLWQAGTTTLLYVWAPWCSICRLSIDNLNDIEGTYSSDKVRVITLVQDYNNIASVKAFQQQTGLRQPILMGNQASIELLRISAFPTYYLIDSQGKVLSHSVGYSTGFGLKVRSWLYQHKPAVPADNNKPS